MKGGKEDLARVVVRGGIDIPDDFLDGEGVV